MSTLANEESALLNDYIVYPQLATSVQRAIDGIEASHNVLNRMYVASGTFILRQITDALRDNRLAINRAGLRITRSAELNGQLYVEFKRKGSAEPEVHTVARAVIKAEMGARLAKYTAELGVALGRNAAEKRK